MRRYRVYRNLTKGNLSILERGGQGWRKIDEADELLLHDCAFLVYEAGQQKVKKEKKKNVHAYICCDHYDKENFTPPTPKKFYTMCYNPYKAPEFRMATQKNIAAPIYNPWLMISSAGILGGDSVPQMIPKPSDQKTVKRAGHDLHT